MFYKQQFTEAKHSARKAIFNKPDEDGATYNSEEPKMDQVGLRASTYYSFVDIASPIFILSLLKLVEGRGWEKTEMIKEVFLGRV